MKILAVKFRALGDTILWTSALEALRAMFPHGVIHLALPKSYLALFRDDSRFQKIFNQENVNSLSKEKYEWVLNFHANSTSRAFCRAARGKKTLIHHHSRTPKNFGSDEKIVNLGKVSSAIDRDLNVLRTMGWSGAPPATKIFWKTQLPLTSKKKLLVGMFASRPAKQWPFQSFFQLVELLGDKFEIVVPYEKIELLKNPFAEKMKRYAHFVHTPNLQDLIEVAASCGYYVGTDSGVKHLAIALGLKTLTVFGPESVGEWHPYPNQKFIQASVPCRTQNLETPGFNWCGVFDCPFAGHSCLSLISPKDVYVQMQSWLK